MASWSGESEETLFNVVCQAAIGEFILSEDQKVVESSSPVEISYQLEDMHLERSVATDRSTLIFRSWYRELKRSQLEQELITANSQENNSVLAEP